MWVPNLLGSIPNTVTSYVTLGKTSFQFPNFQSGIMISRELVRKWRGTKECIDEAEREWKSWLKLNVKKKKKKKILASSPIQSVQFSCSIVSDSWRPYGLQHARPPCPSPNPGVYSNSCPLSWWCHPTTSSSVVPFSSCPQSFPASESFLNLVW